jgi:phthalate 4,5-dioxygenase oxygenase subunit
MKAGNYTGIQGIPNQDLSMWVTMGAITQRSQDRLGASDMAVVEFRKQMLHEVKAFARGEAPIGVGERQAPVGTCSFQAIVEKSTQWQQYAATPIDVQVP